VTFALRNDPTASMAFFSNFPNLSKFILKHPGRVWPHLAALFVSFCPSAVF
jgi:hypothetical protein